MTPAARVRRRHPRALLAGEEVSHDGLVRVDRARLWSLPADPPALVGAAVSEATAAHWSAAGPTASSRQPALDVLREVIAAFRDGGGADKPVYLQVHLSWAEDEDTAPDRPRPVAQQRVLLELAWNLELPEQFDAAAEHVRPRRAGRCWSRPTSGRHVGWLPSWPTSASTGSTCTTSGRSRRVHRRVRPKVLPELASDPTGA
jgi:hypothetical protein